MDEAWMGRELGKDGKDVLSSGRHKLPALTFDNIKCNLKQLLLISPPLLFLYFFPSDDPILNEIHIKITEQQRCLHFKENAKKNPKT